MRIKMLMPKVIDLPGGGKLHLRPGDYYVARDDTWLTEALAIEMIMAGEAEDEEGRIVRPVPVEELADTPPAAEEGLGGDA